MIRLLRIPLSIPLKNYIKLNLFVTGDGTEYNLAESLCWKHPETDAADGPPVLDQGKGLVLGVEHEPELISTILCHSAGVESRESQEKEWLKGKERLKGKENAKGKGKAKGKGRGKG